MQLPRSLGALRGELEGALNGVMDTLDASVKPGGRMGGESVWIHEVKRAFCSVVCLGPVLQAVHAAQMLGCDWGAIGLSRGAGVCLIFRGSMGFHLSLATEDSLKSGDVSPPPHSLCRRIKMCDLYPPSGCAVAPTGLSDPSQQVAAGLAAAGVGAASKDAVGREQQSVPGTALIDSLHSLPGSGVLLMSLSKRVCFRKDELTTRLEESDAHLETVDHELGTRAQAGQQPLVKLQTPQGHLVSTAQSQAWIPAAPPPLPSPSAVPHSPAHASDVPVGKDGPRRLSAHRGLLPTTQSNADSSRVWIQCSPNQVQHASFHSASQICVFVHVCSPFLGRELVGYSEM